VLRHFVASVMADRGASARDIAHQLGNSVEVCEATYIHGYRDRINERNRQLLERPVLVDLDARRKRGASTIRRIRRGTGLARRAAPSVQSCRALD
jgi:hypothetical protein